MSTIIPIFPLPIVALPEELIPLHVFEERYKRMLIEASQFTGMDAFGLCFLRDDEMHRTGCLVKVQKTLHEYENGSLDIVVSGEERFRLQRLIDDEKPYFMGEVKFSPDDEMPINENLRGKAIMLHEHLIELITEGMRGFNVHEREYVSYVLGAFAGLDDGQKQTLLEIPNENDRLECLVDHYSHTINHVRSERDLESHLNNNGYLH